MLGPSRSSRPGLDRRAAGFNLIEVLVAIGVFAIGMVAVASIFPVAILLQKQTVEQIEADHFGRNAQALVAARGFVDTPANWDAVENDGGAAGASADAVAPLPDGALAEWSLADRSYATLIPADQRAVFWVPLVYDADPADNAYAWRVYVFVVRGEGEQTYIKAAGDANPTGEAGAVPAVKRQATTLATGAGGALNRFSAFVNADDVVSTGDQVVDQDGLVYTVSDVGTNWIEVDGIIPGAAGGGVDVWYAAKRANGPSTFVDLITLIDGSAADGGDGDLIR